MRLSGATIQDFKPLVTFALFALVVCTFLRIVQWTVTAKPRSNLSEAAIQPEKSSYR